MWCLRDCFCQDQSINNKLFLASRRDTRAVQPSPITDFVSVYLKLGLTFLLIVVLRAFPPQPQPSSGFKKKRKVSSGFLRTGVFVRNNSKYPGLGAGG